MALRFPFVEDLAVSGLPLAHQPRARAASVALVALGFAIACSDDTAQPSPQNGGPTLGGSAATWTSTTSPTGNAAGANQQTSATATAGGSMGSGGSVNAGGASTGTDGPGVGGASTGGFGSPTARSSGGTAGARSGSFVNGGNTSIVGSSVPGSPPSGGATHSAQGGRGGATMVATTRATGGVAGTTEVATTRATGGVGVGGTTQTMTTKVGGATSAGGRASSNAGAANAGAAAVQGLSWPIDCIPNQTCVNLDYPDIDDNGKAFNCGTPGYAGHEGTDIGVTFAAQDSGTAVLAAADGTVLFAFDGKYDRCPNANEPDCQNPSSYQAGAMNGTTVCTPLGPYCGTGSGSCFWCFAGGNVIVIRHNDVPGVFATRYDHLKRNSVLVRPGDGVKRGQKIAEVGSAGNSTGPHLHFEVWGTGFYELTDPWVGPCGPNTGQSLWAHEPPWGG